MPAGSISVGVRKTRSEFGLFSRAAPAVSEAPISCDNTIVWPSHKTLFPEIRVWTTVFASGSGLFLSGTCSARLAIATNEMPYPSAETVGVKSADGPRGTPRSGLSETTWIEAWRLLRVVTLGGLRMSRPVVVVILSRRVLNCDRVKMLVVPTPVTSSPMDSHATFFRSAVGPSMNFASMVTWWGGGG